MEFTAEKAASLENVKMELRRFAKLRDWDQFHTPRNIALALVGEIGELCEIFQWCHDVGAGTGLPKFSEEKKHHLGEELSDCLLYLVRLADKCDVDLADAVAKKLARNAAKYPADRCRGSSAKYTAYQTEAEPGTATRARGKPKSPATSKPTASKRTASKRTASKSKVNPRAESTKPKVLKKITKTTKRVRR